ncbi:hypothetical protein SDC9_206275 [bioreactor metagenome]|uniref:Glycine zipper domain-containing protein n=1 Tax=bioreactor metagenome TaxID=1076179 RepID=A0A645J4K1_9ZZZZ
MTMGREDPVPMVERPATDPFVGRALTGYQERGTDMKNIRIILSTAACAATLGLVGCASHPTNSQIGTGVGAVAGGLVGDAVFGSTLGTVGGAAAGALIGHEVGKNSDRDRRRGYRY